MKGRIPRQYTEWEGDTEPPDPLHTDRRPFWRHKRERKISPVSLPFYGKGVQGIYAVYNWSEYK